MSGAVSAALQSNLSASGGCRARQSLADGVIGALGGVNNSWIWSRSVLFPPRGALSPPAPTGAAASALIIKPSLSIFPRAAVFCWELRAELGLELSRLFYLVSLHLLVFNVMDRFCNDLCLGWSEKRTRHGVKPVRAEPANFLQQLKAFFPCHAVTP